MQWLIKLSGNFLNLVILTVDFVALKSLMDTVQLIQTNESNILLRSSFMFAEENKNIPSRIHREIAGNTLNTTNNNHNSGNNISTDRYSLNTANKINKSNQSTRVKQYFYLTRFIDFIKMVMCVQFLNCATHIIPLIKWIFPEYVPSPTAQSIIYIAGGITPLLYNFIFKFHTKYGKQVGKSIENARFITVFFLYFCITFACAIIGSLEACSKIVSFVNNDIMSNSSAHSVVAYFVFLAKSNAIPTTFALGELIFCVL